MDKSKRIENLEWQLKSLAEKQDYFNDNIVKVQKELERLKKDISEELKPKVDEDQMMPKLGRSEIPTPIEVLRDGEQSLADKGIAEKKVSVRPKVNVPPTGTRNAARKSSELEQFIGGNVILIAGIIILVIGLAFGVKYSIDHDLIKPSLRIILGYVASLALLGFSMKLRSKYENFSAVLLAGACSSLYIITYVAFASYGFFNRQVTFALMLVFTAFTVVAAMKYNRQIIALLGLVGAYAIPFLTSQDSGNIPALMTYITIVNIGILFVAFKRNWLALNIASFVLTWLLFSFAMFDGFSSDFKTMSFVFANVNYLLFMGMILSYKFIKKKSLGALDIVMMVLNTFIFFAFGYAIIDDSHTQHYLGLFTILVAIYNFIPAYYTYQGEKQEDHLLNILGIGVLSFLTLAIPIQLDGNWVTIFWAIEAGLFLWLGLHKKLKYFNILGFIMAFIAFMSFLDDIASNPLFFRFNKEYIFKPILNMQFISGLMFVGIFSYLSKLVFSSSERLFPKDLNFSQLMNYAIPAMTFIAWLILGVNEISMFTNNFWSATAVTIPVEYAQTFHNLSVKPLSALATFLFFFATVFGLQWLAKNRKVQDQTFDLFITLKGLLLFIFIVGMLPVLNDLGYLVFRSSQEYFSYGNGLVLIRYPIIALAVYAAISIYKNVKQRYASTSIEVISDISLYSALLITLAYELVFYMKAFEIPEPYKLGISVLGAVYTIYLIIRGIFANKSHLRFMGFILLGIIIVKLFFYDIVHLKTLSKTIIFVSLGVCMLISSFLYNKHKAKLFDNE